MPAVRKATPGRNPLFLWDYTKGAPRKKAVGYLDLKTGIWVKERVDPKKHLMRMADMTPGWQVETYMSLGDDLRGLEARVTDGRTFRISRETFEAHRFVKEFGFGQQWFCEYRYWSVAQKGQGILDL